MARQSTNVHRDPDERLTARFCDLRSGGWTFSIAVDDDPTDDVTWFNVTREDATAIRDGAQALLDAMDADEAEGGDPQ